MNISYKIKTQQSYLNEWKKELEQKLLERASNEAKDIYLFLISGKWLEKYEILFFNKNYNDNDSKLKIMYNKHELIDNNKLFNIKEFNKLPNIFPLNSKCWKSLIRNKEKEKEIIIKANFYNHILIFDFYLILNNIKDRIYCFFFLDEKNIIMQSYIKINNKDKEYQIINFLKNKGPQNFISKYINNNPDNNNYYKFKDFEMKIFESQNNNINNINKLTKIYIKTFINKNNINLIKYNDKTIHIKPINKKNNDEENKMYQNNLKIIKIEKSMKREVHKSKKKKFPYFTENIHNILKINKKKEIENEMRPKKIIVPKQRRAPSYGYKS